MISQDPQCQVLLDLPPEILINIFLYLPISSLLACQSVNNYVHNLISNSIEIQYALCRSSATQLDTDNPLTAKERLALLSAKEAKWAELTHDFHRTTQISFLTSGIYDLSGGIYLLGDETRRKLRYTYLPSKQNEEVVWNHLCTNRTIIDMGLCVYEHDLIAIITTHPCIPEIPSRALAQVHTRHEIQLQLHSLSTGLFHPEAEQPILSIITTEDRPAVGIEIVGDNLVLILSQYEHPNKPDDQVFIYRWKTGKLVTRFSAPNCSYSGLLFLTADIFLLPNTNTERLEYWKIPQDDSLVGQPQPLLALSLPKLSGTRFYRHISCRAEPNPTSTFRHSSKPFHADSQHAIAIFTLAIRNNDVAALFPHFPPMYSFIFFVHRNSLVQCLETFSSEISHDRDLQSIPYSKWGEPVCRWFSADAFPTRWITTTAGQRCIIIPDVAFQVDSAPLVLLNFNQNSVAKLLVVEKREREARVRIELAKQRLTELRREGREQVQHNLDQLVATLEQTIVSDPTWDPGTSSVIDSDGEWMDILSDDESDIIDSSSMPRRRVKAMSLEDDALDDREHCFQDIVYSNLPYTVCSSQEKYAFHGVLLDEERILGLKTDQLNRIKSFDILYYG